MSQETFFIYEFQPGLTPSSTGTYQLLFTVADQEIKYPNQVQLFHSFEQFQEALLGSCSSTQGNLHFISKEEVNSVIRSVRHVSDFRQELGASGEKMETTSKKGGNWLSWFKK